MCADVVDQINIHEHPTLANLGARYFPQTRLVPQGHGMKVQQLGSGVQVEGFHGYQEQAQPAIFSGSLQTKPTFPTRS